MLTEATAEPSLWQVFPVVVSAIAGLLGTSGGVAALLMWRHNARKVSSEATKVDAEAANVIVEAAKSLVAPLQGEVERLGSEVSTLRHEVGDLRQNLHERDRLAARHAGWDYLIQEKAQEVGLSFPEPPPLFPEPDESGSTRP